MEALLIKVAVYLAVGLVIFVLNSLLVALAFKVYWGYQELPVEWKEFTWRSALAGLGITVANFIGFGISQVLIGVVNMSPVYGRIISILVQFPLCVAAIYLFFALEEWLESTGIAVLQFVFFAVFAFLMLWLFPVLQTGVAR